MAIHEVDGGWVASAYGMWLDGSYKTATAARLAFRVDPVLLSKAWEAKRGPDGTIADADDFTVEEIRELVRQTRVTRP
jgi:hypothetical protein